VDVREERPGELVRRFTEATGAVRVEAFEAIYTRYERVVVRYCTRLTWPDTHMALDAAHETFIAAWSGLAKLENPDAFGTWLRTIARRQCLRLLKERDTQLIDDLNSLDVREDASRFRDGDDGDTEREEFVRSRLDRITETWSLEDQRLYDLHLRRQIKGPELAKELGVTPTTANQRALNQRAFRLKERLKASFEVEMTVQDGWKDCNGLREILTKAGYKDGILTDEQRQSAIRHISHCPEKCQPRRTHSALKWTPGLLVILCGLRERVFEDIRLVSSVSETPVTGAVRGPARRAEPRQQHRRTKITTVVGVILLLLIVTGAVNQAWPRDSSSADVEDTPISQPIGGHPGVGPPNTKGSQEIQRDAPSDSPATLVTTPGGIADSRPKHDGTRSSDQRSGSGNDSGTVPNSPPPGNGGQQPVPARPVPAEPVPARPVPARPVPAEPVPARPVPARPVPAEPVPAEPVPAEPVPAVMRTLVVHLTNSSQAGASIGVQVGGVTQGTCAGPGTTCEYSVEDGSSVLLTAHDTVYLWAHPNCPGKNTGSCSFAMTEDIGFNLSVMVEPG
jgi:RNA polymerase sigma factor (sigma-70 family)